MRTPEEKKTFVREKFSSISSDYDFLNSVLSFQIDRYWRWLTTRELKMFPEGPVLDLCAGTLPLSLELTRPGLNPCLVMSGGSGFSRFAVMAS